MREGEIVIHGNLADALNRAREVRDRTAQLEEVARTAALFLWACMNGEDAPAILAKQNRLDREIRALEEVDESILAPVYK